MYLFLILGLPLGFLLLVLDAYPRGEYSLAGRAFTRGLAAFIPVSIFARILGAIVPAAYGSFLLTFHEWADRILPYAALPALAFLVFYRPGERLPPGVALRRFPPSMPERCLQSGSARPRGSGRSLDIRSFLPAFPARGDMPGDADGGRYDLPGFRLRTRRADSRGRRRHLRRVAGPLSPFCSAVAARHAARRRPRPRSAVTSPIRTFAAASLPIDD